MQHTPPQNTFKKNLVALSVVTALSFLNANIYAEDLTLDDRPDKTLQKFEDGNSHTYDSLYLSHTPSITNSQFSIDIRNGSTLSVSGTTKINLNATEYDTNSFQQGTHALHIEGKGSKLNLTGDINIFVSQKAENHTIPQIGASAIYADEGAEVKLGNTNSTTKIWTFADKPDNISVKGGASLTFVSTNNQIVGDFDLRELIFQTNATEPSRLTAVFDGCQSYWVGDLLDNGDSFFLFHETDVDLTFQNGAQWIYMDDGSISSITLNQGGIINLYDENIHRFWDQIGLSGYLDKDTLNKVHNYVRIGDLKGNGGIFRLDLNSDDQSKSDMIFIESSSAGTHFIEPYRPQDLTSVSDSNRLTFAFTGKNASGVSFADKQNIYGESLYDYELWISSENITDENKDRFSQLVEDYYKDFYNFDIEDYVDGKYWFINRLTVKQSAAAIGMRSAGYASYDAAVSMDRHDRRLQDAVFQNENKEGLWTRIQYGEVGAEHLYNADLTTVYVGYETPTSDNNRLGVSFAYTDGNSDFQDLKGSGELKRYEASVYDTLTFGPHYLDFVARFGQVDNEFNVVNQSGALSTSGSFDQKYAAVSAEYGYRLIDTRNVFIEPQLQIQAAYLDDYSYKTERNMRVKAENDVSVIGRAGFRAGKYFRAADKTGELYARADVLHQFTDGQEAKFSDLESQVGVVWGDKDTWATFGVGGYMNWKDNVTVQLDVERTAGGETIDTWQVSGRLNYLF